MVKSIVKPVDDIIVVVPEPVRPIYMGPIEVTELGKFYDCWKWMPLREVQTLEVLTCFRELGAKGDDAAFRARMQTPPCQSGHHATISDDDGVERVQLFYQGPFHRSFGTDPGRRSWLPIFTFWGFREIEP